MEGTFASSTVTNDFDGPAGPTTNRILTEDNSWMLTRFLRNRIDGEEEEEEQGGPQFIGHHPQHPQLQQHQTINSKPLTSTTEEEQSSFNYEPLPLPSYDYSDRATHKEFYINDLLHSLESASVSPVLTGDNLSAAADVGVSDAMSAFGFNSILFILLLVTYEVLFRFVPSVYSSRRVRNDPTIVDVPPSILPLSWLPSVLRVDWEKVRMYGGLDAYCYLRFVRLCVRITSIVGVWGIVVLWPIFASGGDYHGGWYHFSMANLSQGSLRIWFPTVFMWLMTFYVLFSINEEYKHYLNLRIQYLAEGNMNVNPQTQHSLMIEEIPRELRSDKALYNYFDSLFPGKVHSAYAVLVIPDLERTAAKRKRAVRRLEKSVAYFEATGTRLTHVVGRKRLRCFGVETYPIRNFGGRVMVEEDDSRSPQRGERVDSMNYYTSQLVSLNETMEEMQREKIEVAMEGNTSTPWLSQMIETASDAATSRLKRNTYTDKIVDSYKKRKGVCGIIRQVALDFLFGGFTLFNRNIDVVIESVSGNVMSSTGFVTFNDLTTVSCAARAALTHDRNNMVAKMAPDPSDIQWEHAHENNSYSKGREWTANVIVMLGAILWSIPIASIQAFATAEQLAQVPGFQWMNSLQGGRFNHFVNGYLPVVALLSLITLLPKTFHYIARVFERRKTMSSVNKSILSRLFIYQLANIYISVTAGSIWTALGTIIDHPGSAFEILATTLPTVVGYFVTLLMTKTLAGLPIVLLRPAPLCRMLFLKCCFKQSLLTQRELNRVHKREELYSCVDYSDQLLVIVICFTYACISPIILPVGAIFFLGSLIVYKKQVLLVYRPEHQQGGQMLPMALRRMLIGLVCGQVTLIGYTFIREAIYQPLFLSPLPIITTLMMNSFTRTYDTPSLQLSLERSKELDANSMVKLRFTETMYRQPVLAEGKVEPLPYRMVREVSMSMVDLERRLSGQSHSRNLGVFHDEGSKMT